MKKSLIVLFFVFAFGLPAQSFSESAEDASTVAVPVLQTRLNYGDIIKESDIRYVDVPSQRVRNNVITDADDIIGKTPRRSIQANRPIRKHEVTTQILIEKGNMVDLIYQTRLIELKTVGVALDNGSKGDTIRVKNSQSGKVVQGIVEAPGFVRVSINREFVASLE